MARRIVAPAMGLYKNGRLWWVRTVLAPLSGGKRSLSTGTDDVRRANAVKQMLDDMADSRNQWEWLDLAVSGEVSLDQLYTHHANGSLEALREQRADAERAAADSDLRPWVDQWVKDRIHGLPSLKISKTTRATYERHTRAFIPPTLPFPKSAFTESAVKTTLAGLEMGTATQHHYLVSLQQFVHYALRRVPLEHNPLEFAWGRRGWAPKGSKPRMLVYEFPKVQAILERMPAGELRAATALLFGTGMELGALLAMTGADVGSDEERTVVAHGTKNGAREDRTIIVDAWAWAIFAPHAKTILPRGRVWSAPPTKPDRRANWKALRTAFYEAQVAAGLVDDPPVNEETRHPLWGEVDVHTLHDCRHSYVVNRSLGLDGEPPQGLDYCVHQLGHTDETMILRIYKKQNIKQRAERLRLVRAQQTAKAAGEK